jgi:hypothetical protein
LRRRRELKIYGTRRPPGALRLPLWGFLHNIWPERSASQHETVRSKAMGPIAGVVTIPLTNRSLFPLFLLCGTWRRIGPGSTQQVRRPARDSCLHLPQGRVPHQAQNAGRVLSAGRSGLMAEGAGLGSGRTNGSAGAGGAAGCVGFEVVVGCATSSRCTAAESESCGNAAT